MPSEIFGVPSLDQVPAAQGNVSLNTFRGTNVVDPVDLQDAATKNYVDLSVAAINTNTGTAIVSGGGVAWTGSNFDYIIAACNYIINGVQYSSPETPVTLDPADGTYDRIDTFYADSTGAAGVITGTPADNPVAPNVDPATQIALTFAYVVANTTEPSITSVDIYLENTEWTTSTNSAGTINLASTNNPYAGSKDIEGTATVAGNLFTAIIPSGTLSPDSYGELIFQIRSKATWPNPKAISIFWMNGTASVGTAATLKQGTYGFDSSNTASYQQIVIPTSVFAVAGAAIDRIRFQVTGGSSSIGWYIDNIILQGGVSSTTTQSVHAIGAGVDGAGRNVVAGFLGYYTAPFSGRITGWSITAKGTSPTCTYDIWKIATGTSVPTSSNTITGGSANRPALTTGNALRSTNTTNWTVNFSSGDIFGFNLDTTANATWTEIIVETLAQ